jgi:hypothetical protein
MVKINQVVNPGFSRMALHSLGLTVIQKLFVGAATGEGARTACLKLGTETNTRIELVSRLKGFIRPVVA